MNDDVDRSSDVNWIGWFAGDFWGVLSMTRMPEGDLYDRLMRDEEAEAEAYAEYQAQTGPHSW